MSIIKHVTLQKIVAHDFQYDPRSIITCQLHKINLSEQAQITLQLRVSLYDLVLRCLAGSLLLADPKKKKFHWGPNPPSASLKVRNCVGSFPIVYYPFFSAEIFSSTRLDLTNATDPLVEGH